MFIVWKTEKKKKKQETENMKQKCFRPNEPIRSKIYQMLIYLPKLRLNQF